MATTNLALKNDHAASEVLSSGSWVNPVADYAEQLFFGVASVAHDDTANLTLTAAQDLNPHVIITGAITAARNVVLRTASGKAWWVYNNTTGGFALTFKTSGGSGVAVPMGGVALLRCDGTNIVNMLGALVASPANLADANIIGGLPVLHRIDVPAGVTGNVDTVLTHKTRVIDVWVVKRVAAGGGAGTIQVLNGASAITDAMSINVADQTVVRCATIDDAAYEIAAAGTLRVTRTRTASTDETATVYVMGLRVV